MKIVDEEPFDCYDLSRRFGTDKKPRIMLVQNSPKGILINDLKNRESWSDLGYKGDDRLNRWALELRARNGRVVAAVAWRYDKERPGHIHTLGTYVSLLYRQRGIGTALWRAMIGITGARVIHAEPVSFEGFTLVKSLKTKFEPLGVRVVWDQKSIKMMGLEDLRCV